MVCVRLSTYPHHHNRPHVFLDDRCAISVKLSAAATCCAAKSWICRFESVRACLYKKDRQKRSGRSETLNVDCLGDDDHDDVTESLGDIGLLHVFVRHEEKTVQRSPPHELLDKKINSVNVLLRAAVDACPGLGDALRSVHFRIVSQLKTMPVQRWQCFETAALVSNKNQTETGNVLRRRPSQNIAIAISKHCHHHVPVRGPAGTIHLKLFETFLAMF